MQAVQEAEDCDRCGRAHHIQEQKGQFSCDEGWHIDYVVGFIIFKNRKVSLVVMRGGTLIMW